MDNSLTGASLHKAQAVLDEIGRFERDSMPALGPSLRPGGSLIGAGTLPHR